MHLLDLLKDSYIHFLILLMTTGLLAILGRSVPTRRLILLLALPVPVIGLAFRWPPVLSAVEIYNILLFLTLLVDRFLLSVDPREIELRRSVGQKFSINQENPVLLHLYNNSTQTIHGWVCDHAPDTFAWGEHSGGIREGRSLLFRFELVPRKRLNLEYSLLPRERGEFVFGHIHVRYRSRLGLLWLTVKGGRSDAVKVYPDLKRMREIQVAYSKSVHLGDVRRRSLGHEGTHFSGLRAYLTGDDIRHLDWRATARMETPIVQTYSPEVDQPILILIDAGRKMQTRVKGLTKFDWALNAALAFAGVAIDRGDQVGVGVFHQEILTLSPIAGGRKHLHEMLESLSALQPAPLEPAYERIMLQSARMLRRRALVVIFTDLVDPLASRALVKSLKAFASHHLLILVTLSDSDLTRLGAQVPDTAFDAYEKGVVLDLLSLRHKTLLGLSKAYGALTIDAPPERLDQALVNRYLAVKLKNKL